MTRRVDGWARRLLPALVLAAAAGSASAAGVLGYGARVGSPIVEISRFQSEWQSLPPCYSRSPTDIKTIWGIPYWVGHSRKPYPINALYSPGTTLPFDGSWNWGVIFIWYSSEVELLNELDRDCKVDLQWSYWRPDQGDWEGPDTVVIRSYRVPKHSKARVTSGYVGNCSFGQGGRLRLSALTPMSDLDRGEWGFGGWYAVYVPELNDLVESVEYDCW